MAISKSKTARKDQAWASYDEVTSIALATYKEITNSARLKRDKVTKTADAIYERTIKRALDTYNVIQKSEFAIYKTKTKTIAGKKQ